LFGHAGIVLGHTWGHYLRFDGEEHLALAGPTRSWKGRAYIIPSLLTRERTPSSVLVTDPKDGENAAVTARWHQRFGPVWLFTPRSAAHEKINVLETIRLQTRLEFGDAHLIAQGVVAPEKLYREHPTSLHFRELAAPLLTAVMLHVLATIAEALLLPVVAIVKVVGFVCVVLVTMLAVLRHVVPPT
jgi:type IV secretion system protein VirD4